MADVPQTIQPAAAPSSSELFTAIRLGRTADVEDLIRRGANVNAIEEDADRTTPLIAASASNNNYEIVRMLIEAGADGLAKDAHGENAYDTAKSTYAYAIEQLLLQKFPSLKPPVKDWDTIVTSGIQQLHIVRGAIANGELSPNYVLGGDQLPLLSYYAKRNMPFVVDFLIDQGANVNQPAGAGAEVPGDHPYDYAAPSPGSRRLIAEAGGHSAHVPAAPDVTLEEVTVQYTGEKVFDFEEADEVPMETILSGDDHLIFKAKNSYFALPRQTIYDGIEDDSQVRFECKKELDGAPYLKDVDMETPYYYIQGNGNFLVLESELDEALDTYKVCELVETTKILKNVASANSVQTTPGMNRSGQQVNIVSADHCQAGTPQKVFQVKGVILKGVMKDGKEMSSKNLKGLGEHLLAAAGEGELEMVQKLLDKGADINFRGESGETPLIAAALILHLEVIKLLLEKGADKTIKANPGGDFEGMNALETAQEATKVGSENANGPEVVRLLSATGGRKKRAKKQYTFPRKFSRKSCKKTPCKKMGFTQKASCRPYKNCYTRSAGRRGVSKKGATYKKKSRK